ncbi:MAG: hypothetical protein IPN60_12230 [Saprospiraceae bacterium]|nr:hypothetical protein [Candidatus Opimibacter skivensis]
MSIEFNQISPTTKIQDINLDSKNRSDDRGARGEEVEEAKGPRDDRIPRSGGERLGRRKKMVAGTIKAQEVERGYQEGESEPWKKRGYGSEMTKHREQKEAREVTLG